MTDNALRIHYIASSWPHGGTFGGQIRSLNIARALRQIGHVHVSVVGSEANDVEAARLTATEFTVAHLVPGHPAPNRTLISRVRWAFDVNYHNVHGMVACEVDRTAIVTGFANYDLIWVMNSRTSNILQIGRWPRAHLDIDDVPSTYCRSARLSEARLGRRLKLRVQEGLLKRRESRLKHRFVTLSVCSENDRLYLGGYPNIHVVPNGFERPRSEPVRNPVAITRIGFIGLYSYPPNLGGMNWFLTTVWPMISSRLPHARLRLVGRDSDGPAAPSLQSVDKLGWVKDPSDEIATWSMMIVPIKQGGGTRIKIADGFSRKCPIVATSLGAFGYAVQDRVHLRIADSSEDFANACLGIVADPIAAKIMAEAAYKAFLAEWTWDAIALKVHAAAEDCVRRARDDSDMT